MRKKKRSTSDKLMKKIPVGAVVTAVLAAVCLLYCLTIYFFMGYGSRFFLIWGVMAVGLCMWSFLLWRRELSEKIPRWIRKLFRAGVLLGVLLLLVVEGLVFSKFHARADAGADYVIVLGAQWKNHGPSYVLQKRLDSAVRYLRDNPDTLVIVSGGQGYNEPITEARGMEGYLVESGIAKERIIQEGASTNTYENLSFSSAFLDKETARVVIVTSDFHVFRATKIARKLGYAHVEGISAGSYPAMLPNNLLREFFGVAKDFVMGNM